MLLALTGDIGVGKTTVARYLETHYGFLHLAFADAPKKIAQEVFKLHTEEMEDRVLKETHLERYPFKTPREIVVDIAESIKGIYPDIWARVVERKLFCRDNVVISDLRFPVEFDMIKKHGGVVVEISKDIKTPKEEARYHLVNNGTIDELHSMLDEFMQVLNIPSVNVYFRPEPYGWM